MSAEPSDEALVREIRSGSTAAFAELMSRYERLVYRISYGYTRHEEDSLDVTQNVFLKAYQGLPTYRGTGSFKAWLMCIAHHENVNWRRDHARHRAEVGLTEAHEAQALSTADPPDSELPDAERRQLLHQAILRLNERQQQAIRLRYFGGLTIGDIAAALECSEGVAKNILFRGLQRLRSQLAAHER